MAWIVISLYAIGLLIGLRYEGRFVERFSYGAFGAGIALSVLKIYELLH